MLHACGFLDPCILKKIKNKSPITQLSSGFK